MCGWPWGTRGWGGARKQSDKEDRSLAVREGNLERNTLMDQAVKTGSENALLSNLHDSVSVDLH